MDQGKPVTISLFWDPRFLGHYVQRSGISNLDWRILKGHSLILHKLHQKGLSLALTFY